MYYLEIQGLQPDAVIAKLERQLCGVRQWQIARAARADRSSIVQWERHSRRVSTSWAGMAYLRIAAGMHNHAAVDYWPCPTVIALAPEKWTGHVLMLMFTHKRMTGT
jgi:hypothetical protein